jgi:hypothetical protein
MGFFLASSLDSGMIRLLSLEDPLAWSGLACHVKMAFKYLVSSSVHCIDPTMVHGM